MLIVRSLALLSGFALIALVQPAPSEALQKKVVKDGKDYTGVIVEVHRDANPKDADLGHIVLKHGNETVKIVVLKSTDIVGKGSTFAALDKGDVITVHAKP